MKIQLPYYYLGAEAYGVGTYNCGEFEEGCTAGASTGSDGGGGLSYTGYNVIIPVALAAALIIAAAVLLVTKFVRKRKAKASV